MAENSNFSNYVYQGQKILKEIKSAKLIQDQIQDALSKQDLKSLYQLKIQYKDSKYLNMRSYNKIMNKTIMIKNIKGIFIFLFIKKGKKKKILK
jgi:hypothetical protein